MKICWISFYKLVISQDSYKETYKELTERLQCATSMQKLKSANYLQGVQSLISYRVILAYKGIDYCGEENKYSWKDDGMLQAAILGHLTKGSDKRESINIKQIVKAIFKYVLQTLYRKFLEEVQYQDICEVTQLLSDYCDESITDVSISLEDELIAWNWDHVFIWHTEQECGEGWLLAPRNPKGFEERTTITLR